MADPNIQNILAALAAQSQGGTPTQGAPPPPMPNTQYPPHQYGPPPSALPSYGLPQPINSGSVDLGGIQPISSGTVSITDALAKAKGFAADKGVPYDPRCM
jgi:far upstream element-binding protein